MIFNARNAAFFAPELTLLVAAGEQEDLCPFFASRHHGALAFLVPKRLPYGTGSSLGSDVLGGPPSGRLAGRFPPGRLLLPGGRGARPVDDDRYMARMRCPSATSRRAAAPPEAFRAGDEDV